MVDNVIDIGAVPEGALTRAVSDSLGAMPWHTPADGALRELALTLAQQIDDSRRRAEGFGSLESFFDPESDAYFRLQKLEAWCDLAKTVGLLAPKLRDVLRDLGGAPGARQGMQAEDKPNGHLARLRAVKNA